MAPIRVLQVVTVMNRGGLETMLMNYYRHIDRNRVQFDFMVHRSEQGHYDDEIRRLGGRIYVMPPIRPGTYRSYFKLLDHFFAEHDEYKIVHSHINENSSFVLRAAYKAGVPCRIAHSHSSHSILDLKYPFRLYARSKMKDVPNYYFACSKQAGKWLFGNKVVQHRKLHVLNNAIQLDEFAPNELVRKEMRKELDLEQKLVIGHVGRFDAKKNQDFAIDVFHAVLKREPQAFLLLVGEGHLQEQMRKKVEKLGISNHVKFLGVRTDISRLMQAMDLFLFPSISEGFPVVLVEAQAAGLRCVVSDTITPEVELSGRVAFMSLKASPQHWAGKILSLTVEHENTLDSLRHNGYDIDDMAAWLTRFYESQVFAVPKKEAIAQ